MCCLALEQGSVGKDAIRFLVEKNAPYGLSSCLKIPHSVLDVCREMDELRSINICPPVLLLKTVAILDMLSYVNDIFATGFGTQNHAPCFECVLGREKE